MGRRNVVWSKRNSSAFQPFSINQQIYSSSCVNFWKLAFSIGKEFSNLVNTYKLYTISCAVVVYAVKFQLTSFDKV
jgi:hypothetical protein